MSVPFPVYPECRISLSRYSTIEKQIDEFRPDVIHVATPFTLGFVGVRFGLRHKVPVVASYHTNFDQYLDYYRLPLLKKMFWSYTTWFHSLCERNYCPSTVTKELLESNGVKNVELWSRGIDTIQYNPHRKDQQLRQKFRIGESKLLLLYVGRMAPEKDLDILLNSYRTLPPDVADQVHLIMVGDGPLMAKLRKEEYSNITWTGFLQNEALSEIYASSDLFVFPSGTETFGNVVLEAMASGLPVVGVEAGGLIDLITHLKDGLLCRPRSVDSFREGINLLVRNPHLRLQMAYFARLNALKRDWDSEFTRLMDSYSKVLQDTAANEYMVLGK
jgi:glycosyltransferase involved in cell wall biosynthesis